MESPPDYQVPVPCEELEEEAPSEGAGAGASATGAGSTTGAGAGAGFGLTTRFLVAFLAFFFITFLAFIFFFGMTRFTDIMLRVWKPNNACAILGLSLL